MLNLQTEIRSYSKETEFESDESIPFSIKEVSNEGEDTFYEIKFGDRSVFTNYDGLRLISAIANAADTIA